MRMQRMVKPRSGSARRDRDRAAQDAPPPVPDTGKLARARRASASAAALLADLD
jgi:hypothetical protein